MSRTIAKIVVDGHASLPLGSIRKILIYLLKTKERIERISVRHA